MYIYIYILVCMYIYIYREREREMTSLVKRDAVRETSRANHDAELRNIDQ